MLCGDVPFLPARKELCFCFCTNTHNTVTILHLQWQCCALLKVTTLPLLLTELELQWGAVSFEE